MNSLSSVAEQLRASREHAGISLEELAQVTRINVQFLKEIEAGKVPNVPQTYVRAFIKSFAEHVDIDSAEILQQLDRSTHEAQQAESVVYAPVSPGAPVSETRRDDQDAVSISKPASLRQARPLLISAILIIVSMVILMIFLHRDRADRSVQEISFADVVKERETKPIPADPGSGSIAQTTSLPVASSARSDSLSLEGVASDSVWVHLEIDHGEAKDYILSKMSHVQWKAKNSFNISVGKASGISLTLNGQKVAALGANDKPANNVTLSWETLRNAHDGSQKKGRK